MVTIFILLWGAESQPKIAANGDNKLRGALGGANWKRFPGLSLLAVGKGDAEMGGAF